MTLRQHWTERRTQVFVYILGGFLLGMTFFSCVDAAQATEGDPHQVVVCKYVSTPGEDEVLQTGQNPIVVDVAALEKDGFAGVFPFEFEDAQGNSVAIRYAESAQDGSIEECPGYVTPTPTPTPTDSPSPTDTPSPSVTETPSPSSTSTSSEPPATHTTTPGKTASRTSSPKHERKTAFTGMDKEWALALVGMLGTIGLGALWFARRRAA